MIQVEHLTNQSAIETESFGLNILTPLMMHGWQKTTTENGKTRNFPLEAEARVLSIKGILRYWWRTLQSNSDIKEMRQEENRLFGGANEGEGDEKKDNRSASGRSPLTLWLKQPLSSDRSVTVLPHRSERKGSSKAIPANLTIQLMVTHRKKDLALKPTHLAYIKYMLILSGFGQRARRGAGALQYEAFRWESNRQVQASLQELLRQLGKEQHFEFPQAESGCILRRDDIKRFTHPELVSVWIGQPYSDADKARSAISNAGHEANQNKLLGYTGKGGRLASPLHATVRQAGGKYVPIITEVSSDKMNTPQYKNARNVFLQALGVRM